MLGAVPAQEMRGKLFGCIDLVQEIHESSKNGFIGKFYSADPLGVCNPWIHCTHETQLSLTQRGMGRGSA